MRTIRRRSCRWRTVRGEVAVEDLAVGDLVVTASGEERPIRWIGHREIDCRAMQEPQRGWPVRIAAHALGRGQPSRDLYVSRNHSVCITCVDDVMVPAFLLVNGATIRPEPANRVGYWHVELETHDVIIANGLRSESYLEWGNRAFFTEAPPADWVAHEGTYDDFCLPVVLGGPELELIQKKLRQRAIQLGYRAVVEPDLQFEVDGEVLPAVCQGLTAVFMFDASTREARIKSNTFVPAEVGPNSDFRSLGVSVRSIMLCGDGGETRSIPMGDDRLSEGFGPLEATGEVAWRWTDGDAMLPGPLWDGLRGTITARIDFALLPTWRWESPTEGAAEAESRPAHLRLVG